MLLATLALTASAAPQADGTARAGAASAGTVDADWILRRLQRPPPVSTPFVELRGSATLKQPLQLSGTYRRPDANTLVREVRAPYAETTTIRNGEATIAREGRASRRFSLARVPELAALQGGFGALLSGDRAAIQSQYTLEAVGAPGSWMLVMRPRDPRAASRLESIVLRGRDGELHCIESRPVQGDPQPTLLGPVAARTPALDSLDAALRLCREPPR